MLGRWVPVLAILLLTAGPVEAGTEDRVVPLEGQVGPYWELQDLHAAGPTFKGSVPLRADESMARVHLEVEDGSVGASQGYVVMFCREPCGLSHDGPHLARAMGPGPFTLDFSVHDVDVLHYRASVDEGVRLDAHLSGSLVLSKVDHQGEDRASASASTVPQTPGPPFAAILLGVGVLGMVALVPSVATRVARWCAAAPLAGLFTRRETLLDHPVRRRIHGVIRAAPGIHVRELRRKLSLPPGQVDHHLQKLVQGGYVVAQTTRGYTAHFVPGTVDRSLMAALARVKSDAARDLLTVVAQGDCATLGVAARRTGVALSTASYHMGRLQRLGLVEVRDRGHPWRITALGRSFLDVVAAKVGSGSRNGPENA